MMSAATYERPSADEMEALGRQLWGEPNKTLSTRREVRFGSSGSKSIKLDELVWYDHESGEGGGYTDLQRKAQSAPPPKSEPQRSNGHANPQQPKAAKRVVATYPYHGPDGELRFEVVRYNPKSFSQRRPDGKGGYIWNLKGIDRVPYRLPELKAAPPDAIVFVPEGEKHVDALMARGLVATTNPEGAGKWRDEYNQHLAGRHIVALADNDPVGEKHAADIVESVLSTAASAHAILLPGLKEKGDVIDWFAAGHTADELLQLAQAEPPPPDNEPDPEPDHAAAVSRVIEEFNDTYMVVNDGGRAIIFRETSDPVLKRNYFERIRFEDFRGLYLNRRVQTGEDENGKPKFALVANLWLRNPRRRQYIGGVVFDPTGIDRESTLNLWRGFGVKPKPGSWDKLKDHLFRVICGGSEELRDYVLNWSARLIQFPAEQGEVAIIMRGGEGAGKGIFARALKRLLGQHGLAISNPKHLTGNFNIHLRDCVLLFADEAFVPADRAHARVLRSIITEPTITIEGKYQNAIECPNFLHILMASNDEWVVPVALDSRRFLVLDVLNIKVGNRPYFTEIYKELDKGGYEAMLHELLHRDISEFDPRKVPATTGLEEQRKLSLPVAEQWWIEVLYRGYVFTSKLGLEAYFAKWDEKVSTELLYASYKAFATDCRERHVLSRETFGRFMTKTVNARPRRLSAAAVGEHLVDVDNPYGGTTRKAQANVQPRPPGYELGDIEACRIAFEVKTGLTFDWPLDGED
jgi:hypothetical protein